MKKIICICLVLAWGRALPAQDILPVLTVDVHKTVGQEECLQLNDPGFLCYDNARHLLYVVNEGDDNILVFTDSLEYVRTIGRFGQGPGEFEGVSAVSAAPDGRLVVTDRGRVQVLSPEGAYLAGFRVPLRSPGIPVCSSMDNEGRIFVPYLEGDNAIRVYDIKGQIIGSFCTTVSKKDGTDSPDDFYMYDNNIHIRVDRDSNIFVVFQNVPILRKYNKKLQLIYEIDLQRLPVVQRRVKAVKEQLRQSPDNSHSYTYTMIAYAVCLDQQYIYMVTPVSGEAVSVFLKSSGKHVKQLKCEKLYRALASSGSNMYLSARESISMTTQFGKEHE